MKLEEVLEFKKDIPEHFNSVNKQGWVFDSGVEVVFYAGKDYKGRYLWACKCFCGEYFIAGTSNLTPSNNRSSCGCRIRKKKLTGSLEDKIKTAERASGYKVLDHGESGYSIDKWKFMCDAGHEFSAKWSKVVKEGTRCPHCSRWGFDRTAPGYFYINSVLNHRQEIIAYKFGVTNSANNKRLDEVARKSIYKLKNEIFLFFEIGEKALLLEKSFGEQFGKRYLTKAEMPDGYTETVKPYSLHIYLDWISNYIKQFKE